MQGFLFSRPLPAKAFEASVQQRGNQQSGSSA
jgi:EAL domain-containing protein (putative c-di-GMP-specific phosphodiesterase class I)